MHLYIVVLKCFSMYNKERILKKWKMMNMMNDFVVRISTNNFNENDNLHK